MKTKTGHLRELITIEQPTRTTDNQGGATIAWSTFSQVWARIEPLSASQVLFSQSLQHRITHRVTIRELSGVTTAMRITYGSRTFQIHGIRDLEEKNRFVEIAAEEGAGA